MKNINITITQIAIIVIAIFGGVAVNWQFDKDWTTLSRDGDTIAKSKWVVEAERTYININSNYRNYVMCPKIIENGGYRTDTRCYYAPDTYELMSRSLINTKIELDNDLVIKSIPFYAYGTRGSYAGYVQEHTIFEDTDKIEEFPDRYTISWKPSDTRNYKLVWRLEKLDTSDYLDGWDLRENANCSFVFGNVKIDLKDECSKLMFTKIEKGKATFYFKQERGLQNLDISFVDPKMIEEEEIVEDIHTGLYLSAKESWRIININDTELLYDIEDISYDGSKFAFNMKVHENITTIPLDAKSIAPMVLEQNLTGKYLKESILNLPMLKDKLNINVKDNNRGKDLDTINFFDDYNRTTGIESYTFDVPADYTDGNNSYNRDRVVLKLGDASIYVTATLDTDLKIVQTGLANETDYVASIDVSEGKLFMSQTNSSYDLTDGLVGWWSFDNNGTYDYSGENNHGTGNPATFGQDKWVTGQVGNALDFDEVNDIVEISASNSLDINGNITVSVWGYFNEYEDGNTLLAGRNASGVSTYKLHQWGTNIYWTLNQEFGNKPNSGIELNKWVHIVGVYNSTHLNLYINGSLSTSVTWTGTINETDDAVYIGSFSTGNYFNGKVDQVKIYNRTLSAAEISDDYDSGMAGLETNVSSTGLVLWTKLDETDTDDTAADSSGEGNIGTLYGYPPETTTGNLSYGMDFDGVEDYVELNSFTTILSHTNNYTISLRSKLNDYTTGQVLFASVHGGSDRMGISQSNSVMRVGFYNGTGYYKSSSMSDTSWHHVVLINDDGVVSGYLDNVLMTGSSSLDSAATVATYIGAKTSPAAYTNGTIDDVRIWNRALTATEISALYNITEPDYETKKSDLSASAVTYDVISNTNTSVVVEVPEISEHYLFTPTYIRANHSSATNYTEFNTTDNSFYGSETVTVTENYLSEPNLTRIRINNTYAMTEYDMYNINLSSYVTFTPNDITGVWYDSYTGNSDNSTLKQSTDYSQWVDTCESGNTTGQVLCLNFNEIYGTLAHDRSGNNNDSTLTNMNTGVDNGNSGWTRDGYFGNAINFDGGNDILTLSDIGNYNYTFSCWFKISNFDIERNLFSNTVSTYPKVTIRTDNKLLVRSANNRYTYSIADIIESGEWMNIVIYFSSEATDTKIYVNSIDVTGNAVYSDPADTWHFNRIGNFFNGTIDEVKIYNRALSAAEITAEYELKKDYYDHLINQEGSTAASENLDVYVTNGSIGNLGVDGTVTIVPQSNMTSSMWMIDFGLTGGYTTDYDYSCGDITTDVPAEVSTNKNGSYALSVSGEMSPLGYSEKLKFGLMKYPIRYTNDSYRAYFQVADNLTKDTVTQLNFNVSDVLDRMNITTADVDTYRLYRISYFGGIHNDTGICYEQPIWVGD